MLEVSRQAPVTLIDGADQRRVACPICGSPGSQNPRESPNYCLCARCHTVYRERVTRAAVRMSGWDGRYYSDPRVLEYYARRRSGFEKMVSLIARRAAGRGVWLDVGCGPGVLLEVVRSRGWSSHGLDTSDVCIREARRRLGAAAVTKGNADEHVKGFSRLAVVSFVDTLRSVVHPGAALADVFAALEPGGWVLIRESHADARRSQRVRELPDMPASFSTPLQEWTPVSLAAVLRVLGFRNAQSLPSPAFTEVGGGERDAAKGLLIAGRRLVKWGAWPAARVLHAMSGGTVHIGHSFLTLGQK